MALSVGGGSNDGSTTDLSPELAKIAFEDFGETPERRQQALIDLRKRIAELPNEKDRLEDVSDVNLIRFIRGRKYDLEKALETTIAPDKKNRKVFVLFPAKGLKYFTDEFIKANPNAMIKFNIWMFDRISRDPHVQVAGLIMINSFQNFTLSDHIRMSKIAPMSHQLASFSFFNKCASIRLAGAFLVEAPMLVRAIFGLAKVFLTAKIRDRFFFLGSDCTPIHNMIEDRSLLPRSLGGETDDDAVGGWVVQQIALTMAEAQQKNG